jgi:hypothetical protein
VEDLHSTEHPRARGSFQCLGIDSPGMFEASSNLAGFFKILVLSRHCHLLRTNAADDT